MTFSRPERGPVLDAVGKGQSNVKYPTSSPYVDEHAHVWEKASPHRGARMFRHDSAAPEGFARGPRMESMRSWTLSFCLSRLECY